MFVGRQRESAAVLDGLHARGHVLILIGGAGMGKSRLLDEVTHAMYGRTTHVSNGKATNESHGQTSQAEPGNVHVLTGRCLPLSVHLPLMPIVDVLRELHVVDDGRLFAQALARCPAFVQDELARLLPELGDPPAGDAQRQRQFEAIRQVLVAARSSAVVIDDLHWCDSASLDLLEYLIVHPDAPAVVLAARANTSEPIQQWLSRILRLPTSQRIDVGPLETDDVRALLESLGWRGSPSAAADISSRSGGIPYFVEQLAAAAGAESADSTEGVEPLPDGLRSVLRERLTGLGSAAVDLLRALSIAGRPISDEEIQALSGERAGDALRELDHRGLIRTSGSKGLRRAPEHALLAEAVRGELIAGELRELHARVAEAFARQPDVDADDVARHLARSSNSDAEIGWRIRAAEQARQRAAPREAYGHLARVISIDPAVDVQVYLDAYTLARHGGETEAAADLAERMIGRFEATAADPVRMQLWHAVGHHRVLRGRAGLDALVRAVEIGRTLPPTSQYGYLLYDFERHLRGHGQDARARVIANELLEVARDGDDPDLRTLAAVEAAWHSLLAGEGDAAMAAITRIEPGSANAIGPGLNAAAMIALAYLTTGRLEDAVVYGRRAVQDRERAGLSTASVTGTLRACVAMAQLERGRVDQAEESLGPVEAGLPAPDAAATAETRSFLDVARGRVDDALRYWEQTPTLLPYPVLLVETAPLLLTVLVEGGRPGEAVRRGLDALELVLACDLSRFAGATICLVRRALADIVEAGQSGRAAQSGNAAQSGSTAQSVKAGQSVNAAQAREDAQARSRWLDSAIAAAPIDPWTPGIFPVTSVADQLLDQAEQSRVTGHSDPTRWRLAAQEWRSLGRPWRSAYCGWREAQAALAARGSRPDAAVTLRQAFAEADGHVPLRAEIIHLARAARIDLGPTPSGSTDGAGNTGNTGTASSRPDGILTERETAVLKLLTDGLTNAEIGRRLYMSPKTASVHVTHILRKLGARSRVDAATKAHQAGLLD